jgi:DNA invertase Pin-like site-specific DNA recombinase
MVFNMSKAPIPAAILVRVSTKKQETARQVSELRTVAESKGWAVVEVCEEQISGTADASERTGLARVRELVEAGTVKRVLVHEVSRLARRNSVAHEFLEFLDAHGVSLYWHAQGIETLLPNGKRNPAASIMFSLLAEMARAERETIVERIKSGLEEAKRKGVKLGRKPGSGLESSALLAKHRDVVKHLTSGQSIRHTAAITGKGVSTVQRVKTAIGA